ncbi:tRNA (5-methylaminomethyl-2-thiouridine)(34)-methyltransferase MnmD [Litorisediminicola beolgyonensis]|uniref:tRNA (5-methylaminomethyl-2-thiouridine)(34)-methyltransferase MnmD n=1 Tax=Litorisediminicola beolgyonensis TaxID=1173614 RepID=A0ABW3ZKS8_9RHOB
MDDQTRLDWRDGVPVSTRFDDPYYSLEDGLAETRHVFLRGNGLPERFRDGFHVAELGFGTGLNLLATVQAWRGAGVVGRLHYTSYELFPLAAEDMIQAQAAFPEVAEIAAELMPYWRSGAREIVLGDLQFRLVEGDARQTVPAATTPVDAWYLDGFAPAKNPELWEPALLQAVADRLAEGGTAASYSAAGHVRRGLASAGLDVARVPGYGRKRHMTVARKDPR